MGIAAPQHVTRPLAKRAHVCASVTAISATSPSSTLTAWPVGDQSSPRPSAPAPPSPQHRTAPLRVRAQACTMPSWTSRASDTPSTRCGTARAVAPSLIGHSGVSPFPNFPPAASPQQYAAPDAPTAHAKRLMSERSKAIAFSGIGIVFQSSSRSLLAGSRIRPHVLSPAHATRPDSSLQRTAPRRSSTTCAGCSRLVRSHADSAARINTALVVTASIAALSDPRRPASCRGRACP